VIIALTGATGFLGGHALAAFTSAGHQVRALTRRPQAEQTGVTWVAGALDRPEALAQLVTSADAVVHVAGVVNAPDAAGFAAGNPVGTQAMIDAAQAAGVQSFIHISSLAVREPGLSLYGASKLEAERVVRDSALDWQVVRPPAIYGPGDMDNLELFRLAKKGMMPLPPPGRLSLIYAADLAALILAMVERGKAGSCYEADDGVANGWSHRDYAQAIAAAVGANPWIFSMPAALVRAGAWMDQHVRGSGAKLTADRAAYFCHPDWVINPDARPPADLWGPTTPTPRGLAETATWYRARSLL
jgi:nucleoside-diphosphate-sugar epimerase